MTGAIRRFFIENPTKFDPREYLKPAREAAKKVVKSRMLAFGCEGQAARIVSLPLEKIAEKYKKGELAQIVQ
jgi:fructose-bisphosphate aldolase class II